MSTKHKSRKDRAAEIAEQIRNAVTELEALQDEIQNWRSGLEGTNLEHTQKYEALGECEDGLNEIVSELESAADDIDEVEFPGMF